MPQKNEKVEVKLPSGETVVAIVPAGMDDSQVGALMRQKHPEYFPKQSTAAQPSDDDRSQIAGAMARMPQSDTTPESGQGPVRRFAERAFDIPDRVFDHPSEFLNPFSRSYWSRVQEQNKQSHDAEGDIPGVFSNLGPFSKAFWSRPALTNTDPIEWPGKQTIADIKAKNYAGAAGDVLPDALSVAQMAVPAAGEVMQMPAVSRNLPRAGRYVGAAGGFKAGGPLGAAAGGIAGDLAGRGLVKIAPRMARSVGIAAPAEAAPLGETSPTATLANELMRLRNPELFNEPATSPANRAARINQILQASKAAEQRPVTTPTEPAAPAAPKPTVNVDDLVSTGRNLGLSPADAKARAQEAIAQFPNDEKAAIQYMAGRRAPQQAPATTPAEQPAQPAPSPVAKAEQIKTIQQEKSAPTVTTQSPVQSETPLNLQARMQAKYGRHYGIPSRDAEYWLFPDGTSSGGGEGVSHLEAVMNTLDKAQMLQGDPFKVFHQNTGAARVITDAREGVLVEAFGPLNAAQMTKLAAVRRGAPLRWDLTGNGPRVSGTGQFRDLAEAARQYYGDASSAQTAPAAKAEQIKVVQQEKAGIVNNPEYVSPLQRSNLAKNQRDMAAFKAKQVASAKPEPSTEEQLQRSIKTLKTPVSGGSPGADLKTFADMVNGAANDMQGQGVHRHGIGDKVFISEVYERLKPKLGQMTLDQFKQKILEAKQKVLVIGSAADQAPMYPKTHQIMNARSKTGGDNSVSFIDAQLPSSASGGAKAASRTADVTSNPYGDRYEEAKRIASEAPGNVIPFLESRMGLSYGQANVYANRMMSEGLVEDGHGRWVGPKKK